MLVVDEILDMVLICNDDRKLTLIGRGYMQLEMITEGYGYRKEHDTGT